MFTWFWQGNFKERDHLENLGVTWEDNIKMDPKKTGWDGVHWIHQAQDGENWQTIVNTVA